MQRANQKLFSPYALHTIGKRPFKEKGFKSVTVKPFLILFERLISRVFLYHVSKSADNILLCGSKLAW
jgi:hypothetical protein